ncbi:MAG: hypothetical protein Q8N52_01650 [Acidobacteriota bacterium]|nr:hypothetical protein [Acidobacteriota bacterium]
MKNLMTPALTILTIAAMSHVGIAQDKMTKPMGKDKTYTGCIAAGDVAGSYTLTHVTAEMAMGGHGDMKKDPAGKDTMGKGTIGKDATTHSMAITSTSVDLAKHVGHKVSLTGPDNGMGMAMGKGDTMGKTTTGKGMAAWSVTSLKMVAATCGM